MANTRTSPDILSNGGCIVRSPPAAHRRNQRQVRWSVAPGDPGLPRCARGPQHRLYPSFGWLLWSPPRVPAGLRKFGQQCDACLAQAATHDQSGRSTQRHLGGARPSMRGLRALGLSQRLKHGINGGFRRSKVGLARCARRFASLDPAPKFGPFGQGPQDAKFFTLRRT